MTSELVVMKAEVKQADKKINKIEANFTAQHSKAT